LILPLRAVGELLTEDIPGWLLVVSQRDLEIHEQE